ncbi:hypothetical protein COEREDRAFT_10401 [Coemansia reversa NRRL 1564]|uniref:Uncharacterized protein n=1 Tax=Coemansia reversa (strain ATCC 12441 / NRRL 1564) TaxID=763665 RepID=A0A2G5B5R9_COERN|nr:hypothetical protein COEREDRAFT_10401 [Coemansia reversa NRRL 1564]|eukprot:PIA14356.1 hypothetical protein COEREDRAFT_10401 [Coemansia reversa NRRL 1564]
MNSNTQRVQKQMTRSVPSLRRVAAYSNLYVAARATEGDVTLSTEQQHSQAELDTSDGKPVAKTFRLDSQSSRSSIGSLSINAHTPGGDGYQTAKHTKGQTQVKVNASTEHHCVENNILTPETLCRAEFDSSTHQHSRANSVVSSDTQAQAPQGMYNAIANGVRAGIMAALLQGVDGQFRQCMQNPQTRYESGASHAQNTVNDGCASDPSASDQRRAGSVAYVGYARHYDAQSPGDGLTVGDSQTHGGARYDDTQPQINGLALGNSHACGGAQNYDARHNYAQTRNNGLAVGGSEARGGARYDDTQPQINGLALGNSHACGGAQNYDARHNYAQTRNNGLAIGGSEVRGRAGQSVLQTGDAGTSSMSASRHKARAATQRIGKTPIRSNWYYKEEALSDSDLKDQEFESSDEEDFDSEERGYIGDMVAQQKLIQQQQRMLYDVKIRCKMLIAAMTSKTGDPHTAILDDFGRSRAANRRANRELDRLRSEVAGLRDKCTQLADATTNQPEVSTATVLCMDAETNTPPALSTSPVHAESATTSEAVAQCIKINNKLKHKLIKICKKKTDYKDQRDVLKLALVRNLIYRPALEGELDY